jgi:hypothetical protein
MGLRTYLPDQWLRLWFLGGPPKVIYEWPGQIGYESENNFAAAMASVLRGIDSATSKRAHAYILLGSIPSVPADVSALMRSALNNSDSRWRLVSKRTRGKADVGKRQATQFKQYSKPAEEYLFHFVKGY